MDNIIKVDFKDGKFYEVIRDLQQWSQGQKLCIEGLDTEKDIEVHFSLTECHGDAVPVATEVSEGNIIAKIPQFIMEGRDDHCGGMSYGAYAFIYERDGDVAETTHKIILVIKKRPKPTDYVYTETEVKTWTKLEERIGDIEKNSAETIKQAVNDYLKENPLESGTSDAVQYIAQTLTEEQQAQARTNIGAASAKEVGQLSATVNDLKNKESGQPTPVTLASEMTDTMKIYLYVGSEDGYTNGDFYYYNGTSWVSGGKYGGESNTGGINSTARALLITILRNGLFSTDQSANITALETALESSGGSGSEGDSETTYTIVNVLTKVTNSNDATFVTKETSYNANLTVDDGYNLDSVTVTMGGVDITSTAYSSGVISIASVTGNIVITAKATQDSSVAPAFELTSPLVLGDTTDSRINDTTNNRIATGETVNDDEDWTVCVDFTSLAGATVISGNNGLVLRNDNNQFKIGYEAPCWYAGAHGQYIGHILDDYQKVDNVPQYKGDNFVAVITWDSSTKTYNCYGTKEATLTLSTISTASEGQVSIGNKNAIGTINRFALYKRILSADEITAWIGQGV